MTETATQSIIHPPKPDDLATAFAAALLSTGRYEDPGAAIAAAWAAVPAFYLERDRYSREIAPMFFVPVGQLDAAREHEARVARGLAEDRLLA